MNLRKMTGYIQTEVLGRKPGDFTRYGSDHEVIKTIGTSLKK
jgi:hypothetical protein